MKESGYYPAGAENDTGAPWNEPTIPDKDFLVDVECVLVKKNVKVTTDDYECTYSGGNIVGVNTDYTDWKQVYKDNRYTIRDLLIILEEYVREDLERYKGSERKERELNRILEDCSDWMVDELNVEEAND